MSGSKQLRHFLFLRSQDWTVEAAAEEAGLGLAEAKLTEADRAKGLLNSIEPLNPAATRAAQPEEPVMAKKDEQTSTEIVQPDFEKAVRIYRRDIKPAVEHAGEHAQEASTGYKAIKNDCHVNTRAAKFVFKLADESEEKRNDILRSLRGLLAQMNIGITDDLVSRAEGIDDTPIVPAAKREALELATLQ